MEVNILLTFQILWNLLKKKAKKKIWDLAVFGFSCHVSLVVPASSDSVPLSFEVSTENTLREKLVGFFSLNIL